MGKRYLESDLNPAQDPVELVKMRAYIEQEQKPHFIIYRRSATLRARVNF